MRTEIVNNKEVEMVIGSSLNPKKFNNNPIVVEMSMLVTILSTNPSNELRLAVIKNISINNAPGI